MDSSPAPERPRSFAELEAAGSEPFFDKNQKVLIAVASVVVLAVIAWVVTGEIREGAEREAGAALVAASDLASYQSTAEQHADTPAAGSALVLAAQTQWEDGQQEASIETLRSFLNQYPDHPARPSAQASLGSRLLRLDRPEEAAQAFQAVVDDPNGRYLAPFALIGLGDIERFAERTEQAAAYYERARTEYPASRFSQEATQRLGQLKAAAPTEIEARTPDVSAPAFDPTQLPAPSPEAAFGFPGGIEAVESAPEAEQAPAAEDSGATEEIPATEAPAAPAEDAPQNP